MKNKLPSIFIDIQLNLNQLSDVVNAVEFREDLNREHGVGESPATLKGRGF